MIEWKGLKRYTVREVARLTNRTTKQVYVWIERGLISTIPIGGVQHVLESELDRFFGNEVTARPLPQSRAAYMRASEAAGKRLRERIGR